MQLFLLGRNDAFISLFSADVLCRNKAMGSHDCHTIIIILITIRKTVFHHSAVNRGLIKLFLWTSAGFFFRLNDFPDKQKLLLQPMPLVGFPVGIARQPWKRLQLLRLPRCGDEVTFASPPVAPSGSFSQPLLGSISAPPRLGIRAAAPSSPRPPSCPSPVWCHS